MVEPGTVIATAHDATVVAADNIPALEAALEAARQHARDDEPHRALRAAEAKAEQQRAHLALAEAEVARLRAELEG
jgi:hypothetical protein